MTDPVADAVVECVALIREAREYRRANLDAVRAGPCPVCGGTGLTWLSDDILAVAIRLGTCGACGGSGKDRSARLPDDPWPEWYARADAAMAAIDKEDGRCPT